MAHILLLRCDRVSSPGLPLSVLCCPVLSCPALACPLLRSTECHTVAPVECDDHGLNKALHSWPLVPLWKFATGSLDHRVGDGYSPSTPCLPCQAHVGFPAPPHDSQPPHQPHTSVHCFSFHFLHLQQE